MFPAYDGKEYRFKDSDPSTRMGRQEVAALLGLETLPAAEGLRYDLEFYSGGIGIMDRHAIAMNADASIWSGVQHHLKCTIPSELFADEDWGEDFHWLLCRDEPIESIDTAALEFVNEERSEFQSICTPEMLVFFQQCSGVNDWHVVWGTEKRLNYLGYTQG